ncbi:MAG: CHRD domain-containing protein, partial [Opitutaceae bacterium]
QLKGVTQVPPVETAASGTAWFWLNPDGTEIRYKLTVVDLSNVTMAHLHLGESGKNGPPVVWLYPSAPPPKEIAGVSNGVLSQGSIKADNLVGPMAGKTIGDLVDAIKAHKIYVNVHTREHPSGEIRGQLE